MYGKCVGTGDQVNGNWTLCPPNEIFAPAWDPIVFLFFAAHVVLWLSGENHKICMFSFMLYPASLMSGGIRRRALSCYQNQETNIINLGENLSYNRRGSQTLRVCITAISNEINLTNKQNILKQKPSWSQIKHQMYLI